MRCKRATPKEWVNYLTISRAIKIIRVKYPCFLYCKLVSNSYKKSRRPKHGMFLDKSKSKTG